MNVGQKIYNSNSSENVLIVCPQGVDALDSVEKLQPGVGSYTVKAEDIGKLKLVVEADRFRIKRDGGSWQSWQVLETGEKIFTPGDSKTTYYQLDFLN